MSNLLCEKHYFMRRFIKFAFNALNHASDVIRYIFEQSVGSKQSVFYQNIEFCCKNLNVTYDIFNKSMYNCVKCVSLACSNFCKTEENNAKANIIKELRMCKTGQCNIMNLTINDIDDIIYNVCVN